MATRIRWTPITNRHNTADRIFNEIWKPFPFEFESRETQPTQPPMDVVEYEDRLEVQVNLPGVAPEAVGIEFDKGVLTIFTEAQVAPEETHYIRQERYQGAYKRAFRVPETVDTTQATAEFEHGVLHLTLPKKPESQPLRIKINAN